MVAHWKGKERVLTVLARLPPAMKAAVKVALDEEIDAVVAAMKQACPVGVDLEREPGDLRKSIHAYDGSRKLPSGGVRTELLKTIVADATDAKGDFIGPHVEFGHQAKGGGHVPAHPWFYPTWRIERAGFRARLAAAVRSAAKAVTGDIARGGG